MWLLKPFRQQEQRSIGFRVAVAVNLVMAVGVVGFLTFDYQRETRQRLKDTAVALQEEALTVRQGVARFRGAGDGAVQDFIDAVCGRMSEANSPEHHIAVEDGGRVLQARAHGRDSAGLYQALRSAAGEPMRGGGGPGERFVVGRHREGGVTVYVGERLDKVRREVRQQVLVRSAGTVAFGLALAGAVNLAVRRVVSGPLRRLVRTIDEIGAGKLGAQAGPFGSAELSRLAGALNGMSLSLAEAEERRRLALAKARRLQQRLLPQAGPVAGLDLAALHRPAEEVAGDYFDVLPAADGTLLLCVADVAGHGVSAAMIAAMLKVLLLDAADARDLPGEILGRLNRRFMAVSSPEDFASVFLALWDPAGTLWYASAGHEPSLFASGGPPAARLSATGPLIGLSEGAAWQTLSLVPKFGDRLLCLTDGAPEAMNPAGEPFGRDRLAELFERGGAEPPARLLEAIDRALQDHLGSGEASDDLTLLAVTFSGPATAVRPPTGGEEDP